MNTSVRDLLYTAEACDEGKSIRHIMEKELFMSSREITRCKQFDDGVCIRRANSSLSIPAFVGKSDADGLHPVFAGKSDSDGFSPVMIRECVFPGDVIRIRIYEDVENEGDIAANDIPLDIVYEDEDILVVNKPGDMVVHPSYAHYTDSLAGAVKGYYIRTSQNHVVRAIGRLDRETSGLVLFAKNRYVAAILSDRQGEMSKRKEYLALASGYFEVMQGTREAPIGETPGQRMVRCVTDDGKRAVTHFAVVRQFDDFALVRLFLETGRTHQIRVHMAHTGHPLLGDGLYGKEIADSHGITRAALHAAHIEFTHPILKKKMSFDADLPQDMKIII